MKRADFDHMASLGVLTFGDLDFRGQCPKEEVEQATFFNRLRREYPGTWGVLALHPRNEGLRYGGQLRAMAKHRAEGMAVGASDIIIPARVSFVCELKRRDYTKCQWQPYQEDYLAAAAKAGGFACVAFGVDAAWQALQVWIEKSSP